MSSIILNIISTFFVKYILKYSNKNIPKKIKIKSDKEQIKQTINIYFFLSPCSITNMFCAPMAKIKLIPVKNPSNK